VQEVGQLIKQINEQQQVRHWLVPTPFWPEANRIEHAKSIVCPDLVLQQFPLRFSDPSTEPIYARILDTLQNAQKLICYSDAIRTHQLVEGVGLSPEQIDVIGHGRVELGEFLKLGKSVPDQNTQKQIALEFLRSYQRTSLADDPYWSRFAWDKSTFVFYSSQARGQKNILSLLRAIEILRHRSNIPIRLVLTCERSAGSDLDLFITDHRLDAWVLFAPGVSNQVLASLYCWASLAVNPTLFEGGFPFTFTEAYSVGTPSLLSDIPMVREKIVESNLKDRMVFDPLDPQDLANKILWGVEHREELIDAQQGLFDGIPKWEMVAKCYSDSLRRLSK
jgi:glycosyltransferase involved in cell wall biosynthesis